MQTVITHRTAFIRRRVRARPWLGRFKAVSESELTPPGKVDRQFLCAILRGREIMADWQMWRRQPDVYLGNGLDGVFTLLLHRLRPEPAS